MKKIYIIVLFACCLVSTNFLHSQTVQVRLQIDLQDSRMSEVGITDNCLLQNTGYMDGCTAEFAEPEDTYCDDDCSSNLDVDITAIWKVGDVTVVGATRNTSSCGWREFPGGGGIVNPETAFDTIVDYNDLIQVRLSGLERDYASELTCTNDDSLFIADDGACLKSPYTEDFNELNDPSSGDYDVSIGSKAASSNLLATTYQTHIENCASDNRTNDYTVRWRYRYHFVSGMTAGTINQTDSVSCDPINPGTIISSGFTSNFNERNWQVSINNGPYSNIGNATSIGYTPPLITSGKYSYRVRYEYLTAFGLQTYANVYSDSRTFEVLLNESTINETTCVIEEAGSVADTLTSSFGCDSIVTTITEYIGPIADFEPVQDENEFFFTNNSTNAVSYFWDFGDGTTSSVENPGHIYSAGGTYIVKLTAFNKNCSSNSKTDTVNIVTTGIHLATIEDQVSLYPNPSNGVFKLRIDGSDFYGETVNFQVYSMSGQLADVRERTIFGSHLEEYNLPELPSGNYILNITFEDENLSFPFVIVGR